MSAVSSIRNDVASDESSVPVHLSATVCPRTTTELTLRCTYPLPLLTLENDWTLVPLAVSASLSYAVDVPSSLSI